MNKTKDPNSYLLFLSGEARLKLELLAKVRGVSLDKLVKTELERLASGITVEELALELATKPDPAKRTTKRRKAKTSTTKRKYTKRHYRKPCPKCGKKVWPQGMTQHVNACKGDENDAA